MTSLYLVRHGQASFGSRDYDQLSPLGVEQARRLGAWLAASGTPCARLRSGTLVRQRETARHCLQAWLGDSATLPEPLPDSGFDEFDHREVLLRAAPEFGQPGHLERVLDAAPDARAAFQRVFADAVARWAGGAHDADYGESWDAFGARCGDAARRALQQADGADVWVFTSAGTIAALLQQVLRVPGAQTLDLLWAILNASVTQLGWRDGRLRLLQFNSVAHLGGGRELRSHR